MSDQDQKECVRGNCTKPARMSINTKRPSRGRIYSTVDYDERTGLKTSEPLCKKHGLDTIIALVNTLVDEDEEATDA